MIRHNVSPELPSRPDWVPLTMRCGQCDRDWDDWQPTNCAPLVWTAHLKTIRCPYCSAKRKLMIRLGPQTDGTDDTGDTGETNNG